MENIIRTLFWFLIGSLSLYLVFTALSYFNFQTNYKFLNVKQDLLQHNLWRICFYVHLISGSVVVLSGIPLFWKRLIPAASYLHKILGRVYVGGVLLVSAPTGFYLAFFTEGGAWASVGMIAMSILWVLITLKALNSILANNIEQHEIWMIRSLVFTLSGITLRLYIPFGNTVLSLEPETNYVIGSYLPWLFNLLIGELLVRYHLNRNL